MILAVNTESFLTISYEEVIFLNIIIIIICAFCTYFRQTNFKQIAISIFNSTVFTFLGGVDSKTSNWLCEDACC